MQLDASDLGLAKTSNTSAEKMPAEIGAISKAIFGDKTKPKASDGSRRVQFLINLYQQQLLRGCSNPNCPTPTCYTYCQSHGEKPPRRFTLASARAAAFYLADRPDPMSNLCPYIFEEIRRVFSPSSGDSQPFEGEADRELWLDRWTSLASGAEFAEESTRQDPASFSQRLFNSQSIDTFLTSGLLSSKGKSTDVEPILPVLVNAEKRLLAGLSSFRKHGETTAAVDGIMNATYALQRFRSYCHYAIMKSGVQDKDFAGLSQPEILQLRLHQFEDVVKNPNPLALRLTCTLAKVLALLKRSTSKDLLRDGPFQEFLRTGTPESQEEHLFSQLLLRIREDPASTGALETLSIWMEPLFMKTWDKSTILHQDSSAYAALSVWDLLSKFEFLEIVEVTKLRVSTGEPMKAALSWMEDRKDGSQGHINLLDYPWILDRQSQVQYFRALCFHHMADAVDDARLNVRLLYNSFSSLISDGRPPPQGPSLQSGRLHMAMSRYLTLLVNRSSILTDALNSLWRRQRRELFRPLRVKMLDAGEVGVDQGGLAQEFFRLVLMEAFKPDYGVFSVDGRTHMAWFDPKSLEPLYKHEMLGLIMGLAIFNGFTLPVTFPLALYMKLCGEQVGFVHIEDGWPDLVSGLQKLQEWSDGDVSDVFMRSYTFTFEAFGEMVHVDMTEHDAKSEWSPIHAMASSDRSEDNAPLVTNETRNEYIDDYVYWLTDRSIRRQYEAFAKGFHTVLEPRLLQTITPEVLKEITEGQQAIDTQKLASIARYDAGYYGHKAYIKDFWTIVHDFDDDGKKRLLEFVTASDRIPVTGIESVDFVVQRHGGDTDSLPTSVTCFGRLLLPEYASREKLKRKLELALENSKGFGLS